MISVKALRAAGFSPEAILKVLEIEQEERLAAVREGNRIRQRNHRARNAVTHDKRDKRDRKTAWPADFIPDPSIALALGWSTEKVNLEIQTFKSHATAKGYRYIDWPAAWRNWVNSPYQQKGNGHGQTPPRPGSRDDLRERNARARDQLKDFARGGSEAGGSDDGWLPFTAPKRP